MLSVEQHRFFETFGYVALRGLLADDIAWIEDEFAAVFDDRGVGHEGSERTCIVPFIDQRKKLRALLDDPRIDGLAADLVGEDYAYLSSDGNYYAGETDWHPDGTWQAARFVKIAFYLDALSAETGALRVIPGSHRPEFREWEARRAAESEELWGIPGDAVPAVALATEPGDVVAFDLNLVHASFGGSRKRRMFTVNVAAPCTSDADLAELAELIRFNGTLGMNQMHADVMRTTAPPVRRRRLEQVMAVERTAGGWIHAFTH